jgi:DNA modification methylase
MVPLHLIRPYENNVKQHPVKQLESVANSIKDFGFRQNIVLDKNNVIVAGHARYEAAAALGIQELPCEIADDLTEEQINAYRILDNEIAMQGYTDALKLNIEMAKLPDFDFKPFNLDIPKIGEIETKNKNVLQAKFLVPPFSVLDTKQGYWQDRKRAWLSMGIKSEMGRGDNNLGFSDAAGSFGRTYGHGLTSHNYGKCLETAGIGEKYGREEMNGTSIFDPVLCELAYRWFSPPDGIVLDPFAGGSVRGIVAAKCGRQYIGIDLRHEQIEANRTQWADMDKGQDLTPLWHLGDSRNIAKIAEGVQADLLFTCPPYSDLEVYSDDPQDISTLNYEDFIKAYKEIITASAALLKNNRFACIVVGDIRDKKGIYRNFISDTIKIFIEAGLSYYNEAILVTAIGSLPIRITKQFTSGRKLGKTHQNVLVFVKGDPRIATEDCGMVEVSEIQE